VDHIFGLEEVGGTSVLILSSVPFERLGFNNPLPKHPLPMLTWQVLSKIPDLVLMAGVLLYGIHWISARREYVRAVSAPTTLPGPVPSTAGRLWSLWRRLTGKWRRP
jgi:formate dehydrogenase iron-sulfur subunit